MKKVLITGATGNVGMEVIKSLERMNHQLHLFAGVRDLIADKNKLSDYKIDLKRFDFLDPCSYKPALKECDIVFLLRPPQISEVQKYFKPFIDTCGESGIQHLVFLSVQGVEKSKIIPHHKIEKLIVDSTITYTFLRPAYFMQNFTTTLRNDLVKNKRIYLPSGEAKFTLIDVCDIGEVSANVLTNIALYKNKSYELTSGDKLTFSEMAELISVSLGVDIQSKSPGLIRFYLAKRRDQMPRMMIFVMIMLHYFPRFQNEPEITNWVEKIIHRPATTFDEFIKRNKKMLTTL